MKNTLAIRDRRRTNAGLPSYCLCRIGFVRLSGNSGRCSASVNIAAGGSRFIPSDYSIDFTRLPTGRNRHLDQRREFYAYLNKAQGVYCGHCHFQGPFADMVTGQMPV